MRFQFTFNIYLCPVFNQIYFYEKNYNIYGSPSLQHI